MGINYITTIGCDSQRGGGDTSTLFLFTSLLGCQSTWGTFIDLIREGKTCISFYLIDFIDLLLLWIWRTCFRNLILRNDKCDPLVSHCEEDRSPAPPTLDQWVGLQHCSTAGEVTADNTNNNGKMIIKLCKDRSWPFVHHHGLDLESIQFIPGTWDMWILHTTYIGYSGVYMDYGLLRWQTIS